MSNKSTVPPYTRTDGTKVRGHVKRKPKSGTRRGADPNAAAAVGGSSEGDVVSTYLNVLDSSVLSAVTEPRWQVSVEKDGPVGELPAEVKWDPAYRLISLSSDSAGSLIVDGPGIAHVVRDGGGRGSAVRLGSGPGNAERYGSGVGGAYRFGAGDARRIGTGVGVAEW